MPERRLALSAEDAERLGEIEDLARAGAVAPLIERLGEPSWAVRRGVVAALAQLGQAAVPGLVTGLTRRSDETRLAATVDALAAARAEVEPALLALAETAIPAVLCDVAQILGRRRADRTAGFLVGLTRHPDDNVAVAAIEALGRLAGTAGVSALIEASASGNFFRVFPAIDVLGRSGDVRAVPALLALLDQPLYAAEVVRSLGHAGDPRAAAPLALRLADEPTIARPAALALLELIERRPARSAEVTRAVQEAAPGETAERLAAALADAEPGERRALAEVLGWLGGGPALAALFQLIADEDAGVARTARKALERLGAAIDELLVRELFAGDAARRLALLPLAGGRAALFPATMVCLDDEDPSVRVAACEALARSGDPAAVPSLFDRLEDVDARVAQAAQGAIQALGSSDTEKLTLAAARSDSPSLRRAAFRIIGYFGYASGLEPLLAGVGDDEPRLAETAIGALALVDDPSAQAALLVAVGEGTAKVRAAAARALGLNVSTPPVLAALRAALADTDAWVRYYASQALGRAHDTLSAPRLIELLHDPAGQVRLAAVEALAQLDHPGALAALGQALGSPEPDVRRAALVGLGLGRRPAALPYLLDALAASDVSTRLVAVSALAELDAPEVVRALARAADGDADANVRSAALAVLSIRPGAAASEALAGLRASELDERLVAALATPVEGRVEGLLAALQHADDERAQRCALALARLARPEAEAALVQVLAVGPRAARLAAAQALAGLVSPLVREALFSASTADADAGVRSAAALALGEP